jgi:hypothetical protein
VRSGPARGVQLNQLVHLHIAEPCILHLLDGSRSLVRCTNRPCEESETPVRLQSRQPCMQKFDLSRVFKTKLASQTGLDELGTIRIVSCAQVGRGVTYRARIGVPGR